MPSIFKKPDPKAAKPAAPKVDPDEMLSKINRNLITARETEAKFNEQAKAALRANNQAMAKQYLNQAKMAKVQQQNLMSQLNMIQMKVNQKNTLEMAKQQTQLMKDMQTDVGNVDQIMGEYQDVMQTQMEQQQQTQQINEMMNQYTEMQMQMMDENGEVDNDLAMLQEEINVEKQAGIQEPQKPITQEEPVKKVVAENNLGDLL